MSVLFVVLGIISGIIIAIILNNLLANKIEGKGHRIALKAIAFIVCIVLGISFAVISSLRTILDSFIKNRIEFIETKFVEILPDSKILETSIETKDLALIGTELQQLTSDIDISNDGFFESFIYNAFLKKLTGYIHTAEKGINTITMASDENGVVTIKSVLYTLKDMALETISPYFLFGQIGIVVLLTIYIIIYIYIVVFLKKGGGMYNKSIVFGNINYDNNKEKSKNKE